jgi:two-component system cell cycle sensor histidine kinase/response regulator CckA
MNSRLPAEELPVGTGAEATVMRVTRQVSAKIGIDCFREMVTHLARALKADCVFVGEFAPGLVQRVTILAASLEGEPASLTFDLPGSACSRVAVTGKPFLCRKEARNRFPSDQLLHRTHAEACIAVPLQNPAGNPMGVLMGTYCVIPADFSTAKSVLAIFAPRAAAELLHKQEKDKLRQRHRAFVELNADGMWCVDFDQPIPTELPAEEQLDLAYQHAYYSECNDAAARLMGLDQCRQVVGRRFVELFPETHPAIRKATLDLIRSGYRFTTREMARLGPDGKRRFLLRSQWGIVENGRLQRVWGVAHDITDFKQCQHALDASKQRMMDLLEAVQLLVLVSDPSGTIQFCNNCFTELTGWRSDDLKNRSCFDLIPAEERAGLQAKFAAWVAGSREPIHFESALQGPGGRRWRVAWDSTVLRDEDGKVKAIASIGRDITQEKALQDQLRQAQKIETVGRLAGGVAHDFNNLLTVIDGYTTLLLDKRSPADPDYPGLTEVRNATTKGAQLTRQLMAFSRRRPCQPEVLNLNTIVERDASMLRRALGEDIDLVTRLDPALGLVRADPGQISQIILNLAVNARDAMTGGGKLTIASSNASISAEQVSIVPGVPSGEYVQLTITDTGAGMTRETLDHLFEPFFTTKEPGKGTGLGLSIVYGILQQSGGYIKVESELGRGTSFRIFLPRIQLEPPAAPVH